MMRWPTLCLIFLFSSTNGQKSCGGRADFVFLLDESASVDESNFKIAKSFVKNVVNSFNVGPSDIQIGLDTFGTTPRNHFNLNQYTTSNDIAAAIDDVDYANGGTNTADAIAFMVRESFSISSGARDDVPRIAIVITDGVSNDNDATRTQAQLARDAGIIIMAVGVGSNVNDGELNDIASDPDDQFVFKVDSFDALKTIQELIAKKACEESKQELCGHAALTSTLTARMLNGRPNGRCEWPWVVSVRDRTSTTTKQCGGVIVSRNKVITTATCAQRITSNNMEVVIGENNIFKDSEPLLSSLVEQVVAVESVVLHPGFDSVLKANDIAVLKLSENIEYNTCALPVCLPGVIPEDDCKQSITHQCTMAGWGVFDGSLRRSKYLRTSYAKFLSFEVCEAIYSYSRNNFLPINTACVESLNKVDNPCSYDDGGMVVCSRNGRWVLHGLITLPSCYDVLPSLVVDVTSEVIEDFIKNA